MGILRQLLIIFSLLLLVSCGDKATTSSNDSVSSSSSSSASSSSSTGYDKIEWQSMDSDKDGSVSPDEMKQHYKDEGVYK